MPFGLFRTPNTVQFDKKKLAKGTIGWSLKQTLKNSLGNGISMKDAVKLPRGELKEEWIAVNTVEIYNNTQLCYRFISEFCSENSCPTMSAGQYSFLWEDGKKYTKPTSIPAPEVTALDAEAHVNTCFKHFYFFAKEFELVDEKDMEPAQKLAEKLESFKKTMTE